MSRCAVYHSEPICRLSDTVASRTSLRPTILYLSDRSANKRKNSHTYVYIYIYIGLDRPLIGTILPLRSRRARTVAIEQPTVIDSRLRRDLLRHLVIGWLGIRIVLDSEAPHHPVGHLLAQLIVFGADHQVSQALQPGLLLSSTEYEIQELGNVFVLRRPSGRRPMKSPRRMKSASTLRPPTLRPPT